MTSVPNHRPKNLSLGPLETEILNLVWELGSATVKDIHERILADPDRELAYTSVTTVLRRLTQKGWLSCDRPLDAARGDRQARAFRWTPLVSRAEAQVLQSHDQLNRFLAVSNPDIVAAFADRLDTASLEQIEAIALRIQAARRAREEQE
ncbi:BlaI/MecI/CopY family transcriptional regulator [Allocoleopsis franciscana]|uniref:Putative transcriptional regulator n=1 Tax=Allocoleopsis franciscana PCC 7113 TaxID=1173027 RepID=K9W6V4_9CYAN|nr:BlaI/MecI/CopY family transcriptional regulator [Allocoleopsis franciscana]AFZ15953.1 putative transcriptional regulator [Allocoleopsis franciscana PCC 7113]